MGCRWNRLDEPVFVSALLFRMTRLRDYVKFYAPWIVSIALPRVKVTPATKDLCPSRWTYSVLHDLVAFLMESDSALLHVDDST